MNILLVEDDSDIRELLAENLKSNGHTVIEAVDSASGFESYRQNKDNIQAIITDYNMPGKDGTGLNGGRLARMIRFLDQKIPIFLYSSEREEDIEKNTGINRMFDKLDSVGLVSCINELEWPMDRSCDI